MTDNDIEVHEIVYHRNGVGGSGFYRIDFDYLADNRRVHLVGIVDGEEYEDRQRVTGAEYGPTRVYIVNPINAHDRYRGDVMADALIAAITTWTVRRDEKVATTA